MSAIDKLFQRLKAEGKKAFMPFVTAGDPNLEFTAAMLRRLDAEGCHLAELGIPYSDPIADGPVIQASYTRSLNGGTKLNGIFAMASDVTAEISMPIVTMVSYAIIYRMGIDEYLRQAIAAGISGAIVPDMPVDESDELAAKCKLLDFSLIQLITPTTPRDRAVQIAEQTTGFIYYVSITGITGERTELPSDLADNLKWLRSVTDLPICVGFGISKLEHVEVLKPVADGLIVGSAIVRRIAAATNDQSKNQDVMDDVGGFAQGMLSAIND
ncbi:tryptophan synthase subunit alpha [bacterium]|jgi:tryptophan synthase alpha chain|nr:tryptophan synthase subunit alpha [bacterium]MDA7924000.1 tryptophan synthase subunit alpha [Mariniblastus sp.]MDB4368714.1 tryptophan synthase subunit alpha [bacterium]MDB4380906.1 tryptophan synthase subunit alpha [Mariniblastus sp.]MDB4399620.1 tryptophan synthase subunit alpha [bacterium]